MQLRFPWILSRRRLLAAVTLDSLLFTLLYNSLFLHRFGRWPDLSISLLILWATWLLSSYVLGRYQGFHGFRSSVDNLFVLQIAVKTALVVTLSLAGILTYLWLFKSNAGDSLFRSFLVPYLGLLGLLSFFIQVLLGFWLRRSRKVETDRWEYLGTPEGFRRLLYHLQWTRLPAKLSHVRYPQLKELDCNCIVVEDIALQPDSVLQLLLELKYQGKTVMTIQEWCESVLQRFPSEYLSDVDLLRGEFSLQRGTFEARLKRLGDVFVSLLLLIVTSPFILVSALLIKIEDGGPIFYSQVRTGLDGVPFTVFKLRSMRLDAERSGAQWVKRADSRITSIGSFLRRTRFDELPQLWCVFSGDMSLIGPRPERPEFDKELENHIPHYRLRYTLRPGLSGWAQVNYPYGASSVDAANKLSYDLYYLRNFSFWLDILILFKTIRLVFNAQGALPQDLSNISTSVNSINTK